MRPGWGFVSLPWVSAGCKCLKYQGNFSSVARCPVLRGAPRPARALELAPVGPDSLTDGGSLLPGVKVKDNETFDTALKRFKKQVEKAGVMFELRRREYYEKPSIRKKKKAIAARKRALKKFRQAPG